MLLQVDVTAGLCYCRFVLLPVDHVNTLKWLEFIWSFGSWTHLIPTYYVSMARQSMQSWLQHTAAFYFLPAQNMYFSCCCLLFVHTSHYISLCVLLSHPTFTGNTDKWQHFKPCHLFVYKLLERTNSDICISYNLVYWQII